MRAFYFSMYSIYSIEIPAWFCFSVEHPNTADGTSEKEAADAIGFGLKLAQSTRMTRPEPHYIHIGKRERETQGHRNKNFVAKPTAYFLPLQQFKRQNVVNKPNWLSNYGKSGGLAGLPYISSAPRDWECSERENTERKPMPLFVRSHERSEVNYMCITICSGRTVVHGASTRRGLLASLTLQDADSTR